MKLIFLDVDGVLNSEEYIVKEHDRLGHEIYVKTYLQQGGIPFDPKCLKFLKYIIDKTMLLSVFLVLGDYLKTKEKD